MVEGPDTSKPAEISTTKNEAPKKKSKEEKQPTKVVIRKLPGSMTEESFLEFISPLFEHDYFYYVQNENPSFGDQSYSRAYINFVNIDDVFTFTMKFDDYIFIDETGQEYPAVVEYAPFQRIPKSRIRRADSFCGIIEEDPDYQEFVRQLESEEERKNSQITEHYFDLANDENEEKITTTPLIEFLLSKKNEFIKNREERKKEKLRREIERKKFKEESRRIKKETKEAKAKVIEKSKDEKKLLPDHKIFEEITSSSMRIRGKSYQEERQRDLARRKMEEKSTKSDDNKENNKMSEKSCDPEDETASKDESVKSILRSDHKEDERKTSFDDKKSYREDDRKSGYYSREKDDKKYSYGVKKREFVGGYDHDGKYKGSKSGGYYYEDYKGRGHGSYQKSTYAGGKYPRGKDNYEEKPSKRYDSKSKKYDYEYKDKKSQKDIDKKYSESKPSDSKSSAEKPKKERQDSESSLKLDSCTLSRSSSKDDDYSGSTSELEGSKSKDAKKDKKESDPRVERRIKNKDRPAMEIYRPGMGKFSRQRLERAKSTESKECE